METWEHSRHDSHKLKLLTFPVPYLSQAGHLPGGPHQGHPGRPEPAGHPRGCGRPTGTDPTKRHYQSTSFPAPGEEGMGQRRSSRFPSMRPPRKRPLEPEGPLATLSPQCATWAPDRSIRACSTQRIVCTAVPILSCVKGTFTPSSARET